MNGILPLIKHYIQMYSTQLWVYIQTMMKHVMVFPQEQKVLAVMTIVLTILMICTPFALYNPNPLTGDSSSYIYMIRNLSFIKAACIMLVHTAILRVRHLDMRYQSMIAKKIGYIGEPIGISCLLFVVGGCIYTSMIDMIVYFNSYSQTLTVTIFGYLIYVIYIAGIAYSVSRLLRNHVPHHTGRVVGFAQTKASNPSPMTKDDIAHKNSLFADTTD